MSSRFSISDDSAQRTRELAEKIRFSSRQSQSALVNLIYLIGLAALEESIFDLNKLLLGEPILNCLNVVSTRSAHQRIVSESEISSPASSTHKQIKTEPSVTLAEKSISKSVKAAKQSSKKVSKTYNPELWEGV